MEKSRIFNIAFLFTFRNLNAPTMRRWNYRGLTWVIPVQHRSQNSSVLTSKNLPEMLSKRRWNYCGLMWVIPLPDSQKGFFVSQQNMLHLPTASISICISQLIKNGSSQNTWSRRHMMKGTTKMQKQTIYKSSQPGKYKMIKVTVVITRQKR